MGYIPDSPLQNLVDFMLEPVKPVSYSWVVSVTSILLASIFVSSVSTITTIMLYRDYNRFDVSSFSNFANWVVSSNSIVISMQLILFISLIMFQRRREFSIITHMPEDSASESSNDDEDIIITSSEYDSDNNSINEEEVCNDQIEFLLTSQNTEESQTSEDNNQTTETNEDTKTDEITNQTPETNDEIQNNGLRILKSLWCEPDPEFPRNRSIVSNKTPSEESKDDVK